MKSLKKLGYSLLVVLYITGCNNDSSITPIPELQAKVLYEYQNNLFIFDPASSEPIQLTNNGATPAELTARDRLHLISNPWSPDGSKVVFNRWFDEAPIVRTCVVNTDGTGLYCFDFESLGPSWSPDGSRLAFYQEKTDVTASFPKYDVFTSNIDGSGIIQLTADENSNTDPIWSPDGSQIAFMKLETDEFHLWTMNSDGTDQAPLVNQKSIGAFDWSPDGSSIAFGGEGITIVDAESGALTSLTTNTAGLGGWSAEGTQIVIDDYEEGLRVINIDGTSSIRVSDFVEGESLNGSISPDGEWVVFVTDNHDIDDYFFDLMALHLETKTLIRLTETPKAEKSPSWSPYLLK